MDIIYIQLRFSVNIYTITSVESLLLADVKLLNNKFNLIFIEFSNDNVLNHKSQFISLFSHSLVKSKK